MHRFSFGEQYVGFSSPPGLGPFMLGTASFGPALVAPGVTADVALADEGVGVGSDACTALPEGSLAGKLALVERGTCLFVVKVKNAQNAGAVGVIVADNVGPVFGAHEYLGYVRGSGRYSTRYERSTLEYSEIEDGVEISVYNGPAPRCGVSYIVVMSSKVTGTEIRLGGRY